MICNIVVCGRIYDVSSIKLFAHSYLCVYVFVRLSLCLSDCMYVRMDGFILLMNIDSNLTKVCDTPPPRVRRQRDNFPWICYSPPGETRPQSRVSAPISSSSSSFIFLLSYVYIPAFIISQMLSKYLTDSTISFFHSKATRKIFEAVEV